MSAWQPPIPAGKLYGPEALKRAEALPLLLWCYDSVDRDGWVTVRIADAHGDLTADPEAPALTYATVARWWRRLTEAGCPIFSAVEDHGRKGYRARFAAAWLDWRRGGGASAQVTKNALEDAGETVSSTSDVTSIALEAETDAPSSTSDVTSIALEEPAYKVLMTLMDSPPTGEGARSAPPAPAPLPARNAIRPPNRDPNQDHPACAVVYQETGIRPSAQAAARIALGYARGGERRPPVADLDRWRETIQTWMSSGNRKNNTEGMLDWYHEPGRMYRPGPQEVPHAQPAARGGRNVPPPVADPGVLGRFRAGFGRSIRKPADRDADQLPDVRRVDPAA